jgi:hypothetical protein
VVRTGEIAVGITVITPSIPERRHLLAEAIESVQAQTFPVAAHLIRMQQPPRAALSTAHTATQLNALLAAVDTEWVAPLGDDDIYLPDHVEKIRPYLGQDAEVVYSWPKDEHDFLRIDVSGWAPSEVARRLEEGNIIRSTITMRTEFVRRIGGWAGEYRDGVFSETGVPYDDWDLLIRLARAGARFRCVPFETWVYRVGDWRHSGTEENDEGNTRQDDEYNTGEDNEDDHAPDFKRRKAANFRVLDARYGIEGAFVDVTNVVTAQVTDGGLAFEATNDVFGGDPAVDQVKEFQIIYSVDGEVEQRLFTEGNSVRLP